MQDKHKVTLYLPPEVHRQLKIRSAVELEPMSALAERALVFYLEHSDVVEEVEMSHGQTHRVYSCPECTAALVMQQGEVVSLNGQPSILAGEAEASAAGVAEQSSDPGRKGESELVPLLG